MYSKSKAKAFMKVVRNNIRDWNKKLAEEGYDYIKVDIYKWNPKSGSVLVRAYNINYAPNDWTRVGLEWVNSLAFMNCRISNAVSIVIHRK